MRNMFMLVFIFSSLGFSCHTSKPAAEKQTTQPQASSQIPAVNYADPATWLLGYFSPARLSEPPHNEWFSKGYDGYQPDRAVIEKLQETDKSDLSIKIVLGTWCPDSRREVPRFGKILDLLNFPKENVTFIGVDHEKVAPVGEYESLGIERVPTFIFLRNKVETGRIIENPVASLEQDMLDILTTNEKQ